MAWKATGRPAVHQHRGRWVVRVEGFDTATGKRRPKQLGSYPSQRSARAAASKATEEGYAQTSRQTVAELVDGWVAGRLHVGEKTLDQYKWAAGHIRNGLGAIAADGLERDEVAAWLQLLANGGALGRRSIAIVRMTLRAAFEEAVQSGDLRRNPVALVPVPRAVVRKPKPKDVDAWDDEQLARFLDAVRKHRWAGPMELEVLYGLRRSELLDLHWPDVDLKRGVVRVRGGLVEVQGRAIRTDGKNERSRRDIPLDANMKRVLRIHRDVQAIERAAAGPEWEDNNLVVATQRGRPVNPRNYNQTLDRLVTKAKVPRLTSHGLRHTAATHMVSSATDLGEVRAAAEILGHSPEMLMKTYSHALPAALRSITKKIGQRAKRAAPPKRTAAPPAERRRSVA